MSIKENTPLFRSIRSSSIALLLLLLVLFVGGIQQTFGQCNGTIDNVAQYCVSNTSTVTFSNAVSSGGTINWVSSGDGTFNNNTIQRPTYTPGARDTANGFAFIYLDVYVDDPINFCSVLPYVTLYFNNMKAAANPATQTVCTGSPLSPIVMSAGINTLTYTWTRNNTATVTGMPVSGTGTIRGILTNTTTAPVTVTFTITPTTPTCTGTPITASVVVNPRIVANVAPATQTVCSGVNIATINPGSNLAGTTFSWTRGNNAAVTGIAEAGTGPITGNLINSTTEAVPVVFAITPSMNGCKGNPVNATVNVLPAPVVTATPASQTICSAASIAPITMSSNTAGTTYNWTRDNTSTVTGIAGSGTGDISGTLTNTNGSVETVNFSITGTAGGCTSPVVNAAVAVNPVLIATATPVIQAICSGTSISTVTLNSNIAGTTYSWTRDNNETIAGIEASGSGDISGTLVNSTTAPVVVNFTITPQAGGCTGSSIIVSITVNPAPTVVASPASQAVCSGTAISSILLSSTTSGTAYSWTRNNNAQVTGIAADGIGDISGSLVNATNTPVTVDFTIVPAAAGCAGAPIVASVTVNPRPTGVISGSQEICVGQSSAPISISLTGTSPWNFTYSDGTTPVSIVGNTANPYTFTVNPASAGTITLTALSDALCQAQPADITGSAVLSQATYTITASAGPNGTISPAGITTLNCGGSQVYNITPDNGFIIGDVLVNGISQGAISSYTFTNVTAASTISATFTTVATNSIAASAGANGSISPAGLVFVANGGSQVFNFTPNSCYQIADVQVNGISLGAISSYTFTNVTASATINVSFTQLSFPVTATAGSLGSISPEGVTDVPCGGTQTYIITPSSNAGIVDVLVNGISQGAVGSYTFTNVTAPQTISAVFAPGNNTITATAGTNGSISPAGTITVPNDASQTFTIVPDACYHIEDVVVDGVSQGAISSYTFSNVTASHTISASFTSTSQTITAYAGPNGDISPAGVSTVSCGASLTYTITPHAGYIVQDVTINGVSHGALGTYTFTHVTSAQSITVTFTPAFYNINASAGANGSITPAGILPVAPGSSVIFDIKADPCYEILNVIVNGKPQGAVSSFTIHDISTDNVISATFRLSEYTITATAGANGSISPQGATVVGCGASQTYSIVPNAGFNIQDVSVNGVSQGPLNSYTFTNVNAAQTISASFIAATTTITAEAGSNGSISPAGTTTINTGSSQTYSIVANSCYQVADVKVNGISQGAISTYTFTNVTSPQTISASFTQITYAITASAGANGSVSPAGVTNVLCGGSQTYSITPANGFVIQNVFVNGVPQGAIGSYTFTNVTATRTINATFAAAGACVAPALSGSITTVRCRNGNTGAIVLTTTGGSAPFTYSWTSSTGFTSTQKDISGLLAGSYTVRVTATGGCSATATYSVTQPAAGLTANSTQGTITCNGGSTTVTVTATGGTLPYTGTGTFTNQLAGARSYTVSDANGCTAVRNITLTQPTLITASISAGTIACSGGTTSLVVTATGGTGARQFSLNGGAFQTGTTFTVNAAGSPYRVTVRDANLCTVLSNSIVVTNPAVSTVPAAPTTVTGQVYGLCGGGTFTYTVQPVANATSYTWSPPSVGSIVSGQGTNQVQISMPSTFTGSGGVGVSARNGCGSSTQYRFTVFAVLAYTAAQVNGPTTVTRGQAGVQYSVPFTAGYTYNWVVPFGATITAGQGTNAITVRFGNNGGNIGLDVTNACGTAPRTVKAVTMAAARMASTSSTAAEPIMVAEETQLNVYPNPAMNTATIQFDLPKGGVKYEVTISSFTDKTILSRTGVSTTGLNSISFDLGRLKQGMYLVKLVSGNDTKTQKLYKL